MKREIIEITCPHCGHSKSYQYKTEHYAAGECISCGEMTFLKQTKEFDVATKPTITCPYCKSTNTKRISGVSKAGKVALFGVFALGKVNKQWHCNNCKSDF